MLGTAGPGRALSKHLAQLNVGSGFLGFCFHKLGVPFLGYLYGKDQSNLRFILGPCVFGNREILDRKDKRNFCYMFLRGFGSLGLWIDG